MTALTAPGWLIRARAPYAGLDRQFLTNAAALALLGLVVSMAASPAAAARMNIEADFHFAGRHAAFVAAGALVLALAARLSAKSARRLGVLVFAAALPLCVIASLTAEVKGAARWIDFGPLSLQPSEFLKPGFVIAIAWMLAEKARNPAFPAIGIAACLYALSAAVLLSQPDIGQTALMGTALAGMMFLSGLSWLWIAGGAAAAVCAGFIAYAAFPHVRARWDAFVSPEGPGGYQVGRALDAIASGGLFGRGPGEGLVKLQLPDAHADFLFAVAAEEFGLLASLGLIGLFAALVLRGLSRASRLADPFAQLAAGGLVLMLAVQAAIHMAVNLALIPAKGMTLPLVSYGGSSMLSAALTIGLVLALTRAAPGHLLFERKGEAHV